VQLSFTLPCSMSHFLSSICTPCLDWMTLAVHAVIVDICSFVLEGAEEGRGGGKGKTRLVGYLTSRVSSSCSSSAW